MLAASILTCWAVQAAPVLQIEKGILIGAKSVNINNVFYDVTFKGQNFVEAYEIIGSTSSKMIFSIESEARAASQALLDQVFLDGPRGQFDTNPLLTRGCDWKDFCLVLTPFVGDGEWSNIEVATAVNRADMLDHVTGRRIYDPYDDIPLIGTYAFWMVSEHQVPEPTSVALLSIALMGLGIARRKQK